MILNTPMTHRIVAESLEIWNVCISLRFSIFSALIAVLLGALVVVAALAILLVRVLSCAIHLFRVLPLIFSL